MTEKKKRKNPWHKRRINKRHRELMELIEDDDNVIKRVEESAAFLKEAEKNSKKLSDISNKCKVILSKPISSQDKLMEGLPIESLDDSFEVSKNGRPNKPQFRDLLALSKLKAEGDKANEVQDQYLIEAKISQMNLLQAQIEALLKISGED